MPDTGRITRGGGAVTFDPITGTMTPGVGTVVHEGPCRLRTPSAVERNVLFGETEVTTTRFIATFPHDIPNVEIGDIVTILASDDPHADERTYRVVIVPADSYLMYRALGVEATE